MDDATVIRRKMDDYHLTYVWLINQLTARKVYTDKSEVSSAINGTRSGAKVDKILSVSLEILEEYERGFLQSTT